MKFLHNKNEFLPELRNILRQIFGRPGHWLVYWTWKLATRTIGAEVNYPLNLGWQNQKIT